MKALKHWKVCLALVLVFAAGAVTGSVGTMVHFKRAFERGLTVENWTAQAMKFLQTELKLTPEQRLIHQRKCQEFRQWVKKVLKVDLPAE